MALVASCFIKPSPSPPLTSERPQTNLQFTIQKMGHCCWAGMCWPQLSGHTGMAGTSRTIYRIFGSNRQKAEHYQPRWYDKSMYQYWTLQPSTTKMTKMPFHHLLFIHRIQKSTFPIPRQKFLDQFLCPVEDDPITVPVLTVVLPVQDNAAVKVSGHPGHHI